MISTRTRINLTLTDGEYSQITAVADILGIKPTRVVYDCLTSNLAGYLEEKQKLQKDIQFAKMFKTQTERIEEKGQESQKAKQKKKKSR